MNPVKYHINPKTGNPNQCNAKYKCPFVSSNEHFSDKDTAREFFEITMEAETINPNKNIKVLRDHLYNYWQLDWNYIDYCLDNIYQDKTQWTKNELKALSINSRIEKILRQSEVTEADYNKIEDFINAFDFTRQPFTGKVEAPTRLESLRDLAKLQLLKHKNYNEPISNPPEREKNDALIGLETAQVTAVKNFNHLPGIENSKPKIMSNAEEQLDYSLNRIMNNEKFIQHDPDASYNDNSIVPERNRLMRLLDKDSSAYDQQLYLATVFPEKELKQNMEQAGLQNVSVTSFYNNREWGNAYTVMTPNGETRTFSVYEHRNTDSIIINGKTNWDSNKEIPYAADHKNAFFAEFAPQDTRQAADALTFYLTEAQKGELPSDDELVATASHRDWRAILSDTVPGFSEWAEKNYGPRPDDYDDPFNQLR